MVNDILRSLQNHVGIFQTTMNKLARNIEEGVNISFSGLDLHIRETVRPLGITQISPPLPAIKGLQNQMPARPGQVGRL